ncbi:hypothetical protein P8452_46229 [Trifolium repens]|nr:hypothetical protein P8452_46229 [Trifolium repens]
MVLVKNLVKSVQLFNCVKKVKILIDDLTSTSSSVVSHFMRFENETRTMPLIWHQSLLAFVQSLHLI